MECLTFFDTRTVGEQGEPLPEFVQAVEAGKVDAVIATMLPGERCIAWLGAFGLPLAIHYTVKDDRVAGFDYKQLVRVALRFLADLECESAGLILPHHFSDVSMLEFIRSTARRFRIKVEYEWMLFYQFDNAHSPEEQGYDLFQTLWSFKRRPRGLIVFPDIVARGVITAVVESRVSQDVRLVVHRNAENPIMVPFEVTWLENSARSLAGALLLQIKRQRKGEPLKSIQVPFRLVSEAPKIGR